MKKNLLLGLILCISLTTTAYALPYTGADIVVAGVDFSDISTMGATPRSGGNEWYVQDDTIWTAWANQWVEYTVSLTAGTWNIGLNAINHGNLGDGWYSFFEIKATTDSSMVFHVNADDSEINYGYFTETLSLDEGEYTVRYAWMNDKYAPNQGLDANIQIASAFFDNVATPPAAPVPEPATMLLLGTGLVGLFGVSRKTRWIKR